MTDAERQIEQSRVDQVIKEIQLQINATRTELAKAHAETRAVEENYGANASINRYEIDDIAESRSAIEQQRQLVARATENEAILQHQLTTLEQLAKQPYFGRIDILDPGEREPESLYIGTASLMGHTKSEFLIYDWRAPISGTYYNGTLGEVSYQTPAGLQNTKLVKKRQFTIIDGQITNMFDTNETVGDEMLQAVLGEQDNQAMRNIVATIQHDQNTIIRDTESDLLVVQGVAGSGKTSTILQRVAFLLYHARNQLNADQMVLFSPNQLFSHYISQVLPSLGERNLRQVTLHNFLQRRFEGLQVESLFERYEERQLDRSHQASDDFFESPASMAAVQDYLALIRQHQRSLQFIDVTFNGRPFFSQKHFQHIWDQIDPQLKLQDQLVKLKNHFIRLLKQRITKIAQSDWLTKELDTLNRQQIQRLLGSKSIDDFEDTAAYDRYLARQIAKQRLRIVYDTLYNNLMIDFPNQYTDFLQWIDLPVAIDRQALIQSFQHQLEFHHFPLSHTAPYLYLRDLLTGRGQNRNFQYVFIDEMQDYPLSLLIYFKHTFPKAQFTVIGDSEQALFRPLEAPQVLLKRVSKSLQAQHSTLVNLQQSYRSTYEITKLATSLLPDGDQITAFSRHGTQPQVIIRHDSTAWQTALIKSAQRLQNDYQTVAILSQDDLQAQALYHLLHPHFGQLSHLTEHDLSLKTGIIILPIYLAKGLEFDAVIIPDISQDHFTRQQTGQLYTMMTRAMHELFMLSLGPITTLITDSQHLQIDQQISFKTK